MIVERSVVKGKPIILSSTRMSKFYFNLRPIALNPVGCKLIVEIMMSMIKKYEAVLPYLSYWLNPIFGIILFQKAWNKSGQT